MDPLEIHLPTPPLMRLAAFNPLFVSFYDLANSLITCLACTIKFYVAGIAETSVCADLIEH